MTLPKLPNAWLEMPVQIDRYLDLKSLPRKPETTPSIAWSKLNKSLFDLKKIYTEQPEIIKNITLHQAKQIISDSTNHMKSSWGKNAEHIFRLQNLK